MRKPERLAFIGVDAGVGMLYSVFILALARLAGYRLVCAHHSSLYLRKPNALSKLVFLTTRRARHIALSDGMKREIRACYGEQIPVVVVDNSAWCDPAHRQYRVTPTRTEFRMGFLSNLSTEKGLDTAINILKAGREAGLPLKLILAGPTANAGAARVLEKALLEKPNDIEYRGYVSGTAKEQFFSDIDVFLFPSQYQNEAQPIVLLEAMAREIPVIASDIGFIGELIRPCGTLVPPGHEFPTAALPHLQRLAADSKMVASLGYAARLRFEELKRTSENNFRLMFAAVPQGSV
jgi:glycosyltransferase involved in cell wall biosynthesis